MPMAQPVQPPSHTPAHALRCTFAAFAFLAFPLLAFAQACSVTEARLAGAWERSGRAGTFEQMEFAREDGAQVFNSWLHERPEFLDGRWSLAGCRLHIATTASSAPAFAYTLRMKGRHQLELRARGEGVARYRRMKPAP